MNRILLGLLSLSMVAAGADMSSERTAEKRLHEIFGTESIETVIPSGRRFTLIRIPDSSRVEVASEQLQLFVSLQRLGTREAVGVLAGFLDDERYIYLPEGDILSASIADLAIKTLETIRREHPKNLPGAPSPARGPDPFNSKAWRAWMESKDQLRINAWRTWWAANKASYDQPSATRIPK